MKSGSRPNVKRWAQGEHSDLRIGDLNKLVSIIGTTRASDGMGGFTETDTTIASNVWAAIWPLSASEKLRSMQVTGEISHRIRIRYRSVFRPDWRIKFGNRYFNVAGPPINPNERNEWLDLMCKEAV